MQACTGEEFYKDESTENSTLLNEEKKTNKTAISDNDTEKNVLSKKIDSKFNSAFQEFINIYKILILKFIH